MDKPLKKLLSTSKRPQNWCRPSYRTHYKEIDQKKKNKGLLQLSMIICISNSNIQAKKGCYRDNRLHAEEQTGTTTAQEWQRLFLQARGYETQAALKPSLITKLKPDTPQEHMGFIKSTCFV